jgi:hypothetical protein
MIYFLDQNKKSMELEIEIDDGQTRSLLLSGWPVHRAARKGSRSLFVELFVFESEKRTNAPFDWPRCF